MTSQRLAEIRKIYSDAEYATKRYGRGNLYIRLGRIMTDEEYEEQRRRVLEYDFI